MLTVLLSVIKQLNVVAFLNLNDEKVTFSSVKHFIHWNYSVTYNNTYKTKQTDFALQ